MTLILVGNKSDLTTERNISRDYAKSFADENGMIYIETSAKTGDNVKEMFEMAVESIYKKVEDNLIDVTQENSGVRLGAGLNGFKIAKIEGAHNKEGCGC